MTLLTWRRLLAAALALAVFMAGPALAAVPQPATDPMSPGPAGLRTTVFTAGSTAYSVDGQVFAMDTAPVLSDGSLLVPVRYLAFGLGVPADGITYQSLGQLQPGLSAIDIKRQRVDGSPVDVAILFNATDPSVDILAPQGLEGGIGLKFTAWPQVLPPGRLLVPCRDLAQALGALVVWNDTTGQATFKTWATLPAAVPALLADQVAMQQGGDQITATYVGLPAGQQTYPYMVDIPNPYYPGPGQNSDLYALVPTLEAFGVPAQNILWDPQSQTLAVAGTSPCRFIYLTVGTNVNDNLTDELADDLDPPDTGPSVSTVGNGILYVDNTIILILAFGFNLQLTDQQGNSIEPILTSGGVLKV